MTLSRKLREPQERSASLAPQLQHGESLSAARAGARQWAGLAALMLPVLLVSIDNTVLSLALPSIAEALQPSATGQLWIVDVYSLVLAGLLVTMGSLGDRFGRRGLLMIGSTGFVLASVASAFAVSAEQLIALRAVTGVFGAMLMPSTLALIRGMFPTDDQRRLAIAIWAACFSAGAAAGPLVGGAVLEHFAWPAVFLIAVPLLVPTLIAVPLLVEESKDPSPGPLDLLGAVASIIALGGAVWVIKDLTAHGLRAVAVGIGLTSIALGGWFVRRQLRSAAPLLDMHLFRNPRFSASITVNLMSVVALTGFLYFVSQHLQLVLHLQPLEAGLTLLPGLVLMIIAGLFVVPASRRWHPALIITVSLLISTSAYALVAVTAADASRTTVMVAFALLGIGIGQAETLSNDLVLAAAPPARAGAASAVSETAYEVGAVLGTTLLGGLLTAHYRASLQLPSGIPEALEAQARETLAGAERAAEMLPQNVAMQLSQAAEQAFSSGVVLTAGVGAVLMCAAAWVAWRFLRR